MRIIRLSDHPGEMLEEMHLRQEVAAKRERTEFREALAQRDEQIRMQQEEARSRHEHALAQHSARLAALHHNRDRARAGHQWWTWLKASLLAWHTRHMRPAPPVLLPHHVPPRPVAPWSGSQPTDREEILTAGMTGENMVAAELGAALADEWALLRGYRNRRGEIDHILLGPQGMFTIEVKHRNATVDIDGDQWQFAKYDRYGNVVDQGRITDRRGRSPSVQLNEPTADLERFLSSRGQPVRARRVVILTHPRSALGSHRNITVDLVATSPGDLIHLISGSPAALDPAQLREVQQFIVRDHQFYARRSSR